MLSVLSEQLLSCGATLITQGTCILVMSVVLQHICPFGKIRLPFLPFHTRRHHDGPLLVSVHLLGLIETPVLNPMVNHDGRPFMQQAIALFVLKSGQQTLVLHQCGTSFYQQDSCLPHTPTTIAIYYHLLHYVRAYAVLFGVMQWVIKHFAWFFFKVMNVSGVEAVVTASSPFLGQGESACLVKPYVDIVTGSYISS